MRIEVNGTRVTGYVDYDQAGHEVDVISISVGAGGLKVKSSIFLPVRHTPAKLVLAVFNEAFSKAEDMYAKTFTGKSHADKGGT